MYFELYLFFEVKWPQNNCEWDYEQETGCQKVIYQHLEIIIRLTKIFLNLALTFFRQCVVNGILKYEMQNIIVFLCEIKLVPTLIIFCWLFILSYLSKLFIYRDMDYQKEVVSKREVYKLSNFSQEWKYSILPFLRKTT